MRDRRRYLHWVFEAKKRFGLSVLNYMVTSNHVHLLVKDTGTVRSPFLGQMLRAIFPTPSLSELNLTDRLRNHR